MDDFTLSVGRGKGWSGEGCWFGAGIIFVGFISLPSEGTGTRAGSEPCTGHSDIFSADDEWW